VQIEHRILGKTGVRVSVIGLGTGAFGFGKLERGVGAGIVRRALELGITYLDTAHYYETELMVGDGIAGERERVFVATKTAKRNRRTAEEDLKLSLKQLGTDYVDLWLMHCVNTIADVDALIAPGGPLDLASEAKRAGQVRFIGMTGHARPNVLAYALERYPLDVVMPALGMIDTLVTGPEHSLLPAVRRLDCGLVAMKVLGNGALAGEHSAAIRHALELGAHTAVVGVQSEAEVEQAAAVGVAPLPLNPDERRRLAALAGRQVARREGCPFWPGDTQVIALEPGWKGGVEMVLPTA